jgi:von Willebrand factor type A domain
MQVRHRVPSIFSLAMVDVLCCALGCVILLWLLTLRQAKAHEDTAEEQNRNTAEMLQSARADRDATAQLLERARKYGDRTGAELASARADRDAAYDLAMDLNERARALENERDELRKQVAASQADARELGKQVTAGRADAREAARKLDELSRHLKDARATAALVPGLRANLKEAQDRAASEAALAGALEKELARRNDDLKKAGREMEVRGKELDTARTYKEKWAASSARVEALERELAALNKSVASLQADKRVLMTEATRARAETLRARAAAENRFAGIELKGRRVVFLVDMSGSMELVDEKTVAPNKWREVRETVARVMRSMPELEKFQVIVFAEEARYLLAGPGRDGWFDYDAKTSPGRVTEALAKVKPAGGTNMYAALETAFRLRPEGLDTIYLLSDGLPNVGAGITADEGRRLSEAERNDRLGRYIRRALRQDWNRDRPGQPRVRVNAIGFFYESPEVGAFLWALSRENDGSFVGMSRP